MQPRPPSGQLVRVLDITPHPDWPNHKIVRVGAETFCRGEDFSFSRKRTVILAPGQIATVTVAFDVFAWAQPGQTMDGETFCYHLAREPFAA